MERLGAGPDGSGPSAEGHRFRIPDPTSGRVNEETIESRA